jgi:hypothetical protein
MGEGEFTWLCGDCFQPLPAPDSDYEGDCLSCAAEALSLDLSGVKADEPASASPKGER